MFWNTWNQVLFECRDMSASGGQDGEAASSQGFLYGFLRGLALRKDSEQPSNIFLPYIRLCLEDLELSGIQTIA